MEEVIFNKRDIKKQLQKLKCGKQAGLDDVRAEWYKWMEESDLCVNVLVDCMNQILAIYWKMEIYHNTGKDPRLY